MTGALLCYCLIHENAILPPFSTSHDSDILLLGEFYISQEDDATTFMLVRKNS